MSQPTSVFAPETVASINRAYVEAIGLCGATAEQADIRHKIAEHMMFLARNGEDDEQRLCRLSVLAVLGRVPNGGHEAEHRPTQDR